MAGQQVARRNVHDVDAVFYLPLDLPFIVRRTLRLVRPRLFVMMETEIWPNLLRQCKRMGVATVLVNGRISSRSYPRYKLARPFFRNVLADVDRFCMQSEESARRVIDIGADPAKVIVTGSLKFDSLDVPGAPSLDGRGHNRVLRYFRMTSGRPVIVAGSTMRDEEADRAAGVQAHQGEHCQSAARPRAAPSRAVRAKWRSWRATRRSSPRKRSDLPIDAEPRADVVVLDTIGELAQVYQIATAVFVGRQPGRHRRAQHPGAGGVRQADRLRAAHAELQGDRRGVRRPGRGHSGDGPRGARRGAARLADRSGAARPAGRRGARARRIESRREGQEPRDHRAVVAAAGRLDGRRPAVPRGPLTCAGSSLQPTRSRAGAGTTSAGPISGAVSPRPSSASAISPSAAAARHRSRPRSRALLLEMGERPSILSRGYARKIRDEGVVIVSDGRSVLAGVERSGDEPQMLARGVPGAAVLVSASRYVAGRIAESRLGCTVHVLDDGFQHFDLARDIDLLVLPDAAEGTRTLPFGRFREPLDAASAADALFVEDAGVLKSVRRPAHVVLTLSGQPTSARSLRFPAASEVRRPTGRRSRLPASQSRNVFRRS